ncbi:MAG: imidazole glycerol phosphate synthase, glutamine amidotransferase subunit [Gammaproteobacteria bacterium RIFCSPHIGHO2_12_FULL_35_23]|nr:MAG: imidazole glycerol phosphate synthase, glutamine amidotransferase subunit [Gammaproteobacteria bacterium RIFCSPHIGHO2_12_FULL_35_23]
MIGIIDLKMGNLRSVFNAIYQLGFDPIVASSNINWQSITHLILPGVGHFQTAMENCRQLDLINPIKEFIAKQRPLLGICLGMQILAEYGEEGGGSQGLNCLSGKVIHLNKKINLPIPHVGWNEIHFKKSHPVFQNIKERADFYFVHSYYYDDSQAETIIGETNYGKYFPSIVGKNNIVGVQFHPEKSQKNGLMLLENFCQWDGQC